jgi:hypothetical protein
MASQPITTSGGPTITHAQNQRSYQFGDSSPTMTLGATSLPPNSSLAFVDMNLASQSAASMSYGGLDSSSYHTNSQQYNNGFAGAHTSDGDAFHPTNLTSQPEPLQYSVSNANQTQTHVNNPQPTYSSVASAMHDQTPTHESMQQQARALSNQKPNPKRNNPNDRRR